MNIEHVRKKNRKSRPVAIGRIPWTSIFYFALVQYGFLSVFWIYDRELPKALTYFQPDTFSLLGIALTCFGHAAILSMLGALCRKYLGKAGLIILVICCCVQASFALVDVSYYVAYGSYPGSQLLVNFLYSPLTVLGYARTASSKVEVLLVLGNLFLSALLSLRLWKEKGIGQSVTVCLLLSLILHGAAVLAFSYSSPAGYKFIIREHSLPVVRWYGTLLQPSGNALEDIRPYFPSERGSGTLKHESKIENVLLVIGECLRPDHLSIYGYERPTTPELEKYKDSFVLMKRAYAHGPSTETSFPVFLTSRYNPSANPPISSVWQRMHSSGVRTSFISSGQMRWGFLDKIAALDEAQYLFTSANADEAEKIKFSSDPRDFSVDDRIALDRFARYFASLPNDARSFGVIHLDASHYPYQEPKEFQAFSPTLGDGDRGRSLGEIRSAMGNAELRARVVNSYDNSIRFFDNSVGYILSKLEQLGRLESTMVVIISDHGEAFGEHGSGFHGTTLFEEQVHVPLMIYLPKQATNLRQHFELHADSPRGLIDLMPTIFDVMGIPSDSEFEGLSLLSPRVKQYELLLFSGFGRKVAVVKGMKKFIFDCLTSEGFHFDLAQDPKENRNLWDGNESSLATFVKAALMK